MHALTRSTMITTLTLVATTVWLASFVARLIEPAFTAPAVDGVMVVIVAYWFAGQAIKAGAGS